MVGENLDMCSVGIAFMALRRYNDLYLRSVFIDSVVAIEGVSRPRQWLVAAKLLSNHAVETSAAERGSNRPSTIMLDRTVPHEFTSSDSRNVDV